MAVPSIKASLKIKKARSCGYPMLALPQAIEAAKALCSGFGDGPYSRENTAKGLGYSSFSGAASGKIGSLVHFGLLSRLGGMYSVTPAAKTAFSYPEEGSGEAIVALAQNPDLYRKLIARFLDKPLPEKLEAILSADYGITGKAAPVAARNFVDTLAFAGLLRDGKVFLPDPDDVAGGDKNKKSGPAEEIFGDGSRAMIKIKLPSEIELYFPENLAYRLSMGEFKDAIENLDKEASGVK